VSSKPVSSDAYEGRRVLAFERLRRRGGRAFAATFREPSNRDKLPPRVIRGIPTVRRLYLPFLCGCSGGSFKIWAVAFPLIGTAGLLSGLLPYVQ
jgi:hypothetical protein